MTRTDYNDPKLLNGLFQGDRNAYYERIKRKTAAYRQSFLAANGIANSCVFNADGSIEFTPIGRLVNPRTYFMLLLSDMQRELSTPIEQAVEKLLIDLELDGWPQFIVDDKYVVDFLLRGEQVIVECDGAEYHKEEDKRRDDYLTSRGFRVLHLAGSTCLNREYAARLIRQFYERDWIPVQYG